jgi:Fe-S-cluster containining protein
MKPIPLPLAASERRLIECTECGRCCTYVGVGINAPTRPRYATDVLWYLYHENVHVYMDGGGEWSVHFEAPCRNLGPDLLCGVYADRPHICRSFDNRTCEVNDAARHALTFREPREFLAWLRAKKPRLYARIATGFVPPPLREPGVGARPRRRRPRRAAATKGRS